MLNSANGGGDGEGDEATRTWSRGLCHSLPKWIEGPGNELGGGNRRSRPAKAKHGSVPRLDSAGRCVDRRGTVTDDSYGQNGRQCMWVEKALYIRRTFEAL